MNLQIFVDFCAFVIYIITLILSLTRGRLNKIKEQKIKEFILPSRINKIDYSLTGLQRQ